MAVSAFVRSVTSNLFPRQTDGMECVVVVCTLAASGWGRTVDRPPRVGSRELFAGGLHFDPMAGSPLFVLLLLLVPRNWYIFVSPQSSVPIRSACGWLLGRGREEEDAQECEEKAGKRCFAVLLRVIRVGWSHLWVKLAGQRRLRNLKINATQQALLGVFGVLVC